ncbi:hypothetical protein D9615_000783 [Tricholomella constricta]|uniref:ER membrane protein complex subunit 6 n=1 Tax=Tricholomella constricta TaxID=117010 RepID=A0A8H5HRL8_9AGAR|nr:hypothetical protein D9615_000783 [Tricholomella constricta]
MGENFLAARAHRRCQRQHIHVITRFADGRDVASTSATVMSTPTEAAAQLIYPANVQANASLTTVKFIASCFAGAAAGILGLQNWLGFALFLAATLLTSAFIHTINCRGTPVKFIQGGVLELLNPGQDNVFTFVLVWTLFYGIVHGETPLKLPPVLAVHPCSPFSVRLDTPLRASLLAS